jgi:hypothetical protein
MKLAIVLSIVALLVLAGCGQTAETPNPQERVTQEEYHALAPGCHVMKNANNGELRCFDCVEGTCKGAKKDEWRFYGDDVFAESGYTCETVNGACALKQ